MDGSRIAVDGQRRGPSEKNVRSTGGRGVGDMLLSEEKEVVRLSGRVCLECAMDDGEVARILAKRKCVA